MDGFQRLKVLIWVHAALGALLLVGLPVAALVTDRKELAIGVLPALFAWSFGVAPLRKRAENLAPEDRVPPTGLPMWIPPMIFVGAFLSPGWLVTPFAGAVAVAWLMAAGTIVLRWMISSCLGLAVHRETWGLVVRAMSIPIVFGLILFWMGFIWIGY